MPFTAKRFNRDFSMATQDYDLTFSVKSYKNKAMGGCDTATITITGPSNSVWQAINWLRCPVEIFNDVYDCVWWGYINDIEITSGTSSVKLSLDNLFNAVRAIYRTPTGADGKTPFLLDDDSINEYGRKELQISLDQVTYDEAYERQVAELENLKKPKVTISKVGESSGVTATINCLGWWHTLEWRYYEQPDGYEGYIVSSATKRIPLPFGRTDTDRSVAQSFSISTLTTWDARTINVELAKVGTPLDNVVLQLRANDSSSGTDTPSSLVLASWFIEGTLLKDQALDIPFLIKPVIDTTSHAFPLADNTIYWIVLKRVNADPNPPPGEAGHDPDYVYDWDASATTYDDKNYFTVSVAEQLEYPRGVLRIFDNTGGAWNPRTPDADMIFRVMGIKETTEQLEDIILGRKRDKVNVSESYSVEIADQTTQNLGFGPTVRAISQRIYITQSQPWKCTTVNIIAKKVGSPLDKIRVEIIESDSSGNPIGSLLAYSTFAGAALTTTLNTIPMLLNVEVTFTPGHYYYISVVRDPWAMDPVNYYSVAVSELLGYTSGVMTLYNSTTTPATRDTRSPNADLLFKANGYQYSDVYFSGGFFNRIDIPFNSFRYTSVYKSGDNVVLSDVEGIMNAGALPDNSGSSSAISTRILARVTREREVEFYLEPQWYPGSIPTHYIRADGRLRDKAGTTVADDVCPVGIWVAFQNVIPPTIDISDLLIVNPFFLEASSYDAESRQLSIETKDEISPFDIGAISQG